MAENQRNGQEELYDVIIIGGGPAGLTAGLYTARARLKTVLFESITVASQATTTDRIENYPGFPAGVGGLVLIDSFKKQALHFGLRIVSSHVHGLRPCESGGAKAWEVTIEDAAYHALSIILATGARPRELGIPGEQRLRGRGVSYCATCDGAFFRDREIVVVGGGDTAVEEAIFLTRFARKVTVIHRRDRLRATKVLQERAFSNEKIAFGWESVVEEIIGTDRVEAVRLKNVTTGEESRLACDGVFIFVGYAPNADFLQGVIALDEAGYIITDQEMAASQDGIFACGDCRKKRLRQVVNACGDGAIAAFSAQQYVEELKGIAYK
ncbi:MAG: thioredoxin-disulfide reductase [Candidatus Omnitrophica bacterium]|nr:thioredoxin-disulfide reductase [Candidatus Omnitrophota bacterium]